MEDTYHPSSPPESRDLIGEIEREIASTMDRLEHAAEARDAKTYKLLTGALKDLCASRSFLTGELSPSQMLPAIEQIIHQADRAEPTP